VKYVYWLDDVFGSYETAEGLERQLEIGTRAQAVEQFEQESPASFWDAVAWEVAQ